MKLMASKIQAICLDMDGTLLNQDHEISQHTKETLVRCLDQGIHVWIVTGRPYCFAKYHALNIDPMVQVIASNGGCFDLGDDIKEITIDAETISKVIDVFQETNVHAFLKGKTDIYTHESYDERFLYDTYNGKANFPTTTSYTDLSWETLKKEAKEIVKMLIYDFDQENLIKTRRQLENDPKITISSYNDISFDVNGENVNKGNSIRTVCEYWNIPLEKVIAFGDGYNDIPMFEVCGMTVAMANAKPEIQAKCDWVTKSNNEDGIAYMLEKILGNELYQ